MLQSSKKSGRAPLATLAEPPPAARLASQQAAREPLSLAGAGGAGASSGQLTRGCPLPLPLLVGHASAALPALALAGARPASLQP